MDVGAALGVLLAVAPVVTKLVDVARNAFDANDNVPKVWWNALAFGLGIAAAFVTDLNILGSMLGEAVDVSVGVGKVVTGIAIGSFASGYHELFDALSGAAASSPKGVLPKATP
jgi:hypothetical protein